MGAKAAAWALAVLCVGALCAERVGVVRGGGGVSRSGGFRGGPRSSPVVIKMHQLRMQGPGRLQRPGAFPGGGRRPAWPTRYGGGGVIRSSPALHPPARHTGVVRNRAVMRDIRAQQRVEVVPGRYYWHDANGLRYVHYLDRNRADWYGFYFGPRFYWCRRWDDRWWWYDPTLANWTFWYDGYWWWQAPAGVMYVYVDNNFYPYDEESGVVTVKQPEVQAPAGQAPEPGQGRVFKSPDGARMVQISGAKAEAFLYDDTRKPPVFMKYLARGVERARFSGGAGERPLEILLDFKDGTFALFDAGGQPLDRAPAPRGQ